MEAQEGAAEAVWSNLRFSELLPSQGELWRAAGEVGGQHTVPLMSMVSTVTEG